jgi:hypothetical protein
MTQQFGDATSPESRPSTTEVARDEATDVARTAADRGGDVAGTVGEQASRVASETKRQARDLFHESRQQLTSQARQGQQRAAEGLHTLADQVRRMSEKTDEQGVAAEVARQVADRAHGMASWLERREPGDLIEEVRRFARRKPGVFLVGAALAGVAVGRLTRGAIAAQSDDDNGRSGSTRTPTAAGPYGAQTPEAPGYPAAPAQPHATETPGYSMPPTPAGPPAPPLPPGPPVPPAPPTWDPQRGPVSR